MQTKQQLNQLMDLKVDFAFKQLFGREENKHITIIFLNALLKRSDEDRILDISFENIEILPEHEGDKQARLDILARTNRNERVNIEIQFTNKYDMVKRSLYYWATLYRKPMKAGKSYTELQPVIVINILNFDLLKKETNRFHSRFCLLEGEEKFLLTDLMEMHFVEMPKLLKSWRDKQLNPSDDVLARWLLLLGTVDRKNNEVYKDILRKLEEIAMSDPVLNEAMHNWKELSADEQKQQQYESRMKVVMDELAAQREAELRMEASLKEGMEKGMEKGIKEGIEKGIKKGIKKGIEKGKADIVNAMLRKGMSVEEVANLTEVSIEEIAKLKSDHENKQGPVF